ISELPALLVWVPLLTLHNLAKYEVNMFSNNRDIATCQSFRTTTTPSTTTTQFSSKTAELMITTW
ncbi:MAG: hypothetical protein AB2693_01755, partial [Candidatus Thiodiazotropha sp.]